MTTQDVLLKRVNALGNNCTLSPFKYFSELQILLFLPLGWRDFFRLCFTDEANSDRRQTARLVKEPDRSCRGILPEPDCPGVKEPGDRVGMSERDCERKVELAYRLVPF